MTSRKYPVIRLRSQVVWDYLALKKRPQNWLADELGISRGHLSMLLNHDRAPSGKLCIRIRRFLGVEDFDELFYTEEDLRRRPGDEGGRHRPEPRS